MSSQASRAGGPKKKLFFTVAIVIVVGAIGFLAFGGIGKNLVYYWNPTELLQNEARAVGAKIRLGGMVKQGSLPKSYNAEKFSELTFVVTDMKHDVKVHTRSVPPQMFREGIGVVIEGTYTKEGVFESERLLVKHGNEYQPPKPGEAVDTKKLMKSMAESKK
ncbi:MAG: cytochrome c maturation protein CcmE [Deltaproteobacteria bacterium]|nr:cytochrome c maturation protein CcmE [Deltaproteobacteria bacterium]